MKELSLREIQLEELELLKLFDRLCYKHNLTYRLIGGTLLGAVRHQGFIPWDDDVDVCMPRSDYEKFSRLDLSNELPDYVSRISRYDKEHAYSFAKLVNKRIRIDTLYAEKADLFLWIDIFPVDGLPQSEIQIRLLYRAVHTLQCMQGLCYAKLGAGKTKFRIWAKQYLKPIARLIKTSTYTKLIEYLCQKHSFENASYVAVVNGGLHGENERMKKADFLKVQYVSFEGFQVPVAACWEIYLKQIYGDYMQLPPLNDRKKHIAKAWNNL